MEKTLFEEIYSGVSIKNITFAMLTQLDELKYSLHHLMIIHKCNRILRLSLVEVNNGMLVVFKMKRQSI